MNWGKSILLAFILFGAFISALVTVCMRQDISLVTPEYYKEELAYQNQIDRLANTAVLPERPLIQVQSGHMIKVTYKDFHRIQEGSLELFRPSDAALDKIFELGAGDEYDRYFSTAALEPGLYRARLKWTMDGRGYYLEQVINL